MPDNKDQIHTSPLLYTTDLSVIEVIPKNGRYFTLEELQGYVGGRIEIIPLEKEGLDNCLLVVHEEGKLIDLPFNIFASMEWIKYYGNTDFVLGDAIICPPGYIR